MPVFCSELRVPCRVLPQHARSHLARSCGSTIVVVGAFGIVGISKLSRRALARREGVTGLKASLEGVLKT